MRHVPCFSNSAKQLDTAFVEQVYHVVCRVQLNQPGACLVDLGCDVTSLELRGFMVRLKSLLSDTHSRIRPGQFLGFATMGRYDQQNSTRLHIDNGPKESILMLGYEATEVESRFSLADYSACAESLGISPEMFLSLYMPTTRACPPLEPFTKEIDSYRASSNQVVLINNSQASSFNGEQWQGLLHTADIPKPDPLLTRVINSTMIVPCESGESEPVCKETQKEFATTMAIMH